MMTWGGEGEGEGVAARPAFKNNNNKRAALLPLPSHFCLARSCAICCVKSPRMLKVCSAAGVGSSSSVTFLALPPRLLCRPISQLKLTSSTARWRHYSA